MAESVYNLIKPPTEHTTKQTMYRSKFNPKAPPSNSTSGPKKEAATFGKEVVETINPKAFLKRGDHIPVLPEPVPFQRPIPVKKSAVPLRSEKPVMGLTTEKNFLVSNAVDNILSAPKNRGSEAPTASTAGANFGKVPNYLKKIKKNISEEYAYLSQVDKDTGVAQSENSKMQLLQEDEKAEIIVALKKRWEEVHKHYQSLTFNIDTVTKTQRKETIELTLEQIEKSIQKLSKKTIYIYDDY